LQPGLFGRSLHSWKFDSVKAKLETEENAMPLEDNKAIVRRAYLDGMNNRDLSIIDETFAPDYVVHYPGMEPIEGREAAKEAIAAFLDAFPDIVFKIEDQVAEGNKVVTRWSAHGTHNGDFRGFPKKGNLIPASGRAVFFSATDIYLIVNGYIKEEWNTLENMELYRQLGVVSPPS
jgi:predicted ester cyclase